MPNPHLRPFDLAIVAAYLIGITLFGLRFRNKKSATQQGPSLKSYFLADNTIPWWAIALSIVSAETSTLTIISIPGVAFAGDFGFLQVVLGYMLGRIVVALLFLPRYFAGEMLTAYQLIDTRFGPVLHKVTAGLFLLTRAAAEGVRVFAVSIVVGIAIGTGDTLSIGIISLLTLLYTFEGGMAAVIWTDVVQMAIYVGGTLVAVWSLGHHIPGGWATIHHVAGAAGKFHLFNFALNLTTTYTFWAGILGGTFLTMASHGTDQLMVQRMLAARSLRESRLALLSSGVVIFIQFTLFLLIGAGLFVFYGMSNTSGAPSVPLHGTGGIANLTPDRLFPTFIVHELPTGIAGLLIAAILAAAMSNLSAALNSLSSTTVVDFYMRLRPNADSHERNLISKSSTVLWAIVLFVIAIYSLSVGGKGNVVEIGLSIASVAYGCLLGVFLLGTLTKFATEIGTAIGMLCGFILNIWLWQCSFPKGFFPYGRAFVDGPGFTYSKPMYRLTIPHIAFTWYVLIGAIVTFAIGALASLIFRKQSKRTTTTVVASLLLPLLFMLPFRGEAEEPASLEAPQTSGAPSVPLHGTGGYDFSPITTLLNDAIAAHKLPGAVVLIGHNNQIVFHHAYGNRKLANEPGFLDGNPSPAEPMTEETIFDMASLTKCLATATAVMQLYEQGKIASFDDPLVKYLPEFAAAGSTASPTSLKASANSTASPTSSKASATSSPATTPSAGGATLYQRGAQPHDPPQKETLRAGGPTYSPATFDRSKVTLRMLLTHTSGEAPDVDLKDPWGLAAPDRAVGLHRALTTPLKAAPGSIFTYSDINFILLGDLVETLSGRREDSYAREHIFKPLGMTETRYLPFDKACDGQLRVGAAIALAPLPPPGTPGGPGCGFDSWTPRTLLLRVAPTAHDNEGTPVTNPDFDHLLRGTVHDPTTRRMGGVAGHAGVFSTAHDIALYASALLQKLRDNSGPFPLKQSTLLLMTAPEQPGHTPQDIFNANIAGDPQIQCGLHQSTTNQDEIRRNCEHTPPIPPTYPAVPGHNLRGYGWDIDTAFSKPRGTIFPVGSFGHTGFPGTSLWMDPLSNTYVILLANAIHPRGNPPISNLRGQVATASAHALGLDHPDPNTVILSEGAEPHPAPQSKDPEAVGPASSAKNLSTPTSSSPQTTLVKGTTSVVPPNASLEVGALAPDAPSSSSGDIKSPSASKYPEASASGLTPPQKDSGLQLLGYALPDQADHSQEKPQPLQRRLSDREKSQPSESAEALLTHYSCSWVGPCNTLTGIDVLESTNFAALKGLRKLGVLTNQTGLDSHGHRTIDVLFTTHYSLFTIFTPEHGLAGTLDRENIASSIDPTTKLPVISLYGKPADRHPTHDQLKDLDAVLVDLQDAGVHFWTYEAATGYFLEAAALEKSQFHHDLQIIILDRPNPVGGLAIQGPISDPGTESYVNYMPLPVRHGLTLGELMRYANAMKHLDASLTVIPMQHWQRSMTYADTGLPQKDGKLNLSPNLRSVEATLRYPALGLIEYTNISVGRGTDHPFSFFGAGVAQLPKSVILSEGAGSHPAPQSKDPESSKFTQAAKNISASTLRFNATTVAAALTARHLPGVTFTATTETIADDANHYPFHGQTIPAVQLLLTDPATADTPEIAIEILSILQKLYPNQLNLGRDQTLLCSQSTIDAIKRGDDARDIAARWQPSLDAFRAATKPYLLY